MKDFIKGILIPAILGAIVTFTLIHVFILAPANITWW